MNHLIMLVAVAAAGTAGLGAPAGGPGAAELEKQFRELPMEARRLTGPLFWLHGDESKERLERYLEIVAEGGNGCFTAESRPHKDWLGPGWYRDLGICLRAAKRLNLKMWIFDEKWWPSGEVGRKVPPKYGSKTMVAAATDVEGPRRLTQDVAAERLIAVMAGKQAGKGIDGGSLIDLTGKVAGGKLTWDAPAGKWRVMTYTWRYARGRRGRPLVDGASRDAVEWYIRTVYQPHYDHFKEEFGKTIVGYFYDEPETHGDWGTEVIPELKARGVDWKKALVAWKLKLADDDEQIAAKYQYHDAFAEAWGRTLYGALSQWCRKRNVLSIGHWLEHNREYLHPRKCAGNVFQVMKYSDMGGIDAVFRQFVPGRKDGSTYQTPKLGSSISHVYGKADDLTMVEIFGARGQDLSYPEMKWWTDLMHVAGVNFHIPHSFNPRSPYDRDCPPYFYNGGHEPRWPLYRVYADYTSRLSLMLTGGRHVCPVAFLFLGNSYHVGRSITPENMTTALQDALFDCDWMPYDVFEGEAKVADRALHLHKERYQVLVVPAAEVIPHKTLAKVKAFFDAGGTVIGYGILPSKSATLGKTSADIAALREAIWGQPKPGLKASKTNAAGGRSYLLPAKPTPEDIRKALTDDAGIHPTLEVLRGETDNWLHVLHRVKAGRDVFLLCNQDHQGRARAFRFRVTAAGVPECWDAMRNEITAVPHRRTGPSVEIDLTLAPLESVLLVFQAEKRALPVRLTDAAKPLRAAIPVTRVQAPVSAAAKLELPKEDRTFDGCAWVWYPEGNPAVSAPPAARYFRGKLSLPAGRAVRKAVFHITADNDFVLYVNGTKAGASDGSREGWRAAKRIDVRKHLRPGANQLAVRAVNATDQASPAGLIGRLVVEFDGGKPLDSRIDKTWKAAKDGPPGWQKAGFDDAAWASAKAVARFGARPWGRLGGGRLTRSPVTADPFIGRCRIPADVDLSRSRLVLQINDLAPEEAARVTVNGAYAGGFIGKPLRLDVTRHLKPGVNTIRIEPFAPKSARLVVHAR